MTKSNAKEYYDILGINEYSDSEEVEAAYKELLYRNQPESFIDEEMKASALQKREQAKKAYDYVMCRLEVKNQSLDLQYEKIQSLLNEKNTEEAELRLEVIDETDRQGEWYFLNGCLMEQKGWYIEASAAFETACTYDPSDTRYKEAFDAMKKNVSEYKHGYRQSGKNHSIGKCFSDWLCVECMCECCCEGCCEGLCEGLGNC